MTTHLTKHQPLRKAASSMALRWASAVLVSLLLGLVSRAQSVSVEYQRIEPGAASFQFSRIPRPSSSDAATSATFKILQGESDRNGGNLDVLHDGQLPRQEDQPSRNFFFASGTKGGRILVELEKLIHVRQINSYSWHPASRAPQVYRVYGAGGQEPGFQSEPEPDSDPGKAGWKFIAGVDTRENDQPRGGQYGVSISPNSEFRYLLFDISPTETSDPFGNTFYSEIDVVDRDAPALAKEDKPAAPIVDHVSIANGKYDATVDTTETPDLTPWAREKLIPMVREWYPKIVALLPSEGYDAPTNFSIVFSDEMRGVAATGGTRIRCAASWFRRNLEGEAVGAVFHELVHVVQQYGRGRRNNPNATRTPGWLVEGIADYIRWFLYEPGTHGAEITSRNLTRAKYDASYRITANFLDWVTRNYAPDLVRELNAAAREARYSEDLWKKATGKSLPELGEEWRAYHEKKLAGEPSNTSPK